MPDHGYIRQEERGKEMTMVYCTQVGHTYGMHVESEHCLSAQPVAQVHVHSSDETVCAFPDRAEGKPYATCLHSEPVVRRDARDWVGAEVR